MSTNESKITQEELDKLEATHGRIAHLRGKGGTWEIVLRKPNRAEYKQFRSRSNNPELAPDAQEQLARQCVVYPSRDAFDALLEEWPAIPEAASKAFSNLMGLAVEADSK